MDKKGEIDFLSKIVRPNIGIITNISYAHAKNFNNIFQIAKAKSEIIYNIKKDGYIILNADDKFFSFHKKIAIKRKLKIISFGFSNKSNIKFIKINNSAVFEMNVLIFIESLVFKLISYVI
jgi:murE/murF fusion protein